jgi:hypothetical protein
VLGRYRSGDEREEERGESELHHRKNLAYLRPALPFFFASRGRGQAGGFYKNWWLSH